MHAFPTRDNTFRTFVWEILFYVPSATSSITMARTKKVPKGLSPLELEEALHRSSAPAPAPTAPAPAPSAPAPSAPAPAPATAPATA